MGGEASGGRHCQGVIARVWNVAHRPVEGAVEFARPLAQARQTTHIETDLEPVRLIEGKLPVALAPQQMKTFRLTVTTPAKGK